MSGRTKLCITALFLVLLAIPAAYIALTWSPDDALRFRVDHLAPPLRGNPQSDRRLCVSIENTTFAPVHFYGAAMTDARTAPVIPEPTYSKITAGRDLLSGAVSLQTLTEEVPVDPGYAVRVPAVVIFDVPIGESLVIPAHSTVHVAALLPPKLADATPPRDIFVHYHWETQTHVTAKKFAQWLRHCTSSWAPNLIPWLSHRQDTTPLQGSLK